jgi:hypothetical protein
MDSDKIREYFVKENVEFEPERKKGPLRLLIRGRGEYGPLVGIRANPSAEMQISVIVDSIHWCLTRYHTDSALRILINEDELKGGVLEALATLIAARRPSSKLELKFMPDGKPKDPPNPPTFENDRQIEKWMESIGKRLRNESTPDLVRALSDKMEDPSFRWYLGVVANYWSGRVEGLEVCRFDLRRQCGSLDVGLRRLKEGTSKARAIATKKLQALPDCFGISEVGKVAQTLRQISESRQKGGLKKEDYQPEHFYESRILREAIPIYPESLRGASLGVVFKGRPFQFPAKWWHSEHRARYIDILMRDGNVPWVVELKYANRWDEGRDQYFRHAISQAVLYRGFIKKAPAVRILFKQSELNLDATRCRALVALACPEPRGEELFRRLKNLAGDFNVEVVHLPT